jgi:preprotein translocase subunit SecD
LKNTERIRNRQILTAWKLVVCITIICILSGMGTADVEPKWQTGFYLVIGEAPSAAALPQPNSSQQVMQYSNRFLLDPDSEPSRYLLLASRPDVPLKLVKSPEYTPKGANGFPELQMELTADAARALETLTRKHLGQEVAFVVDGEPVTIHKIRSAITGGRFVLSRCTDTACQYIYGRLKTEP